MDFSKFLNGFVKVDTWVSLSCYMDVEATGSVPAEFVVQISGLKMKAEFIKIFKLFEELEEAGECATLTISSKGGTSSIKLLLECPLSLPTTASRPTTLPPASRKRRCHRGAAAMACGRQRAADHTKPASWRGVCLLLLLLL